jgi:hypothetical protein
MFGKLSGKSKALEAPKQHARNLKRLPRQQILAGQAEAYQMVYAVNPIYLEMTQGGASPMRGWGALILVLGVSLGLLHALASIEAIYLALFVRDSEWSGFDIFLEALMVSGGFLCAALPALWLYLNFFTVTDVVARFDRKRRKVWVWRAKQPLELDWDRLQPAVSSGAASAHMPSRIYTGLYAEFAPDGEFVTTNGQPHVVQVGGVSGAEEGVRPALEYVRVFMEQGPQALPPPGALLRHRPRWYAMVNLFGMADEWADHFAGRPTPLGKPWVRTIAFVVFFPLLFPLQFTNWLALRVAPLPRWPRELELMHAADLRDVITHEPGSSPKRAARARRTPVIRVNGELADPGSRSETEH